MSIEIERVNFQEMKGLCQVGSEERVDVGLEYRHRFSPSSFYLLHLRIRKGKGFRLTSSHGRVGKEQRLSETENK